MRAFPTRAAGTSAAFVFIWATGFIAARFVAPYAEPIAFVAARLVATALVLTGLALAWRVRWPGRWREWRNAAIAGILMQGIYVLGVFWAVAHGVPAGIAALVGSLQPLLTAAVAGPALGEVVTARRWTGVALGFVGAALVLAPKLSAVDGSAIPPAALAVSLSAMIAMTAGTLWQKGAPTGTDLLAGTAIQFMAAAGVAVPLALLVSDGRVAFGPALAFGFAWSVLVNSVAGILLLMALIKRGAVAGVATLLFLVPPVSALIAYGLFGETLVPLQLVGMAAAAGGVALAGRG